MTSVNRDDVLEKVTSIISEQCSVEQSRIDESSQLDTIGADSLDRVEIVITLEETFNIEISDEVADTITTVKGFVDHIMEQKQA